MSKKTRNPFASTLSDPKYRKKIVVPKPKRQVKHKKKENEDV